MAIDKKWSGRTKVRTLEVPRDPPIYFPRNRRHRISDPMLVGVTFVGVNRIYIFGVDCVKCSSKAIMGCEYGNIHAVPNMKMYILLHREYFNYVHGALPCFWS
jgi:hypothetical protein